MAAVAEYPIFSQQNMVSDLSPRLVQWCRILWSETNAPAARRSQDGRWSTRDPECRCRVFTHTTYSKNSKSVLWFCVSRRIFFPKLDTWETEKRRNDLIDVIIYGRRGVTKFETDEDGRTEERTNGRTPYVFCRALTAFAHSESETVMRRRRSFQFQQSIMTG